MVSFCSPESFVLALKMNLVFEFLSVNLAGKGYRLLEMEVIHRNNEMRQRREDRIEVS